MYVSSQAAPPPQQTTSACIINQDDWGGKHTGGIPSLYSVCLHFCVFLSMHVCQCVCICMCVFVSDRQKTVKRFEAKVLQKQS